MNKSQKVVTSGTEEAKRVGFLNVKIISFVGNWSRARLLFVNKVGSLMKREGKDNEQQDSRAIDLTRIMFKRTASISVCHLIPPEAGCAERCRPTSAKRLSSRGGTISKREAGKGHARLLHNLTLTTAVPSTKGRFSVHCEKTILCLKKHGKKCFVILTKSFVKIGIAKTFCYNKMFSSVNKTFGCCSKIFGCSNKNFICCP